MTISRTDTDGRSNASPGLPMHQRNWAVLAISLNTLMVVIDQAIVNVALPSAARALSATPSEIIPLVAVPQFVSLVALLPFAALGDRLGHSFLYRAGQLMFIVGAALCMFASTLPLLLAARALQAIGAAAVLSVGMALLRAIYPSSLLGRGLGINGVLIAVGAAVAPSLGGLVVATVGWRWVFVCGLPLAMGSLLLGRWLPRPVALHREFDWRGALHYALTATLILVAVNTLAYGGSAVAAGTLLLIALGVGADFVKREWVRNRPIFPVDLLATPVFALSSIAAFLTFMGGTAMLLSLPFMLESMLGNHPARIGATMMAWPVAMIVSAPIAGAMADRLPGGSLSAFGMALVCTGFVWIARASDTATQMDFVARIALCGFGMGFFISPNSRRLLGITPSERTASVGGLISTTRLFGQSCGAAMVALLMQPWLDQADLVPVIAALLAFSAALLSLAHLLPAIRNSERVWRQKEHGFTENESY